MANPFGDILTDLPESLLETLPAMKPPPGEVPNFVDPYSKGPILVIASTITLFLGLCFFGIRIYTKLFIVRKAAWDDCKALSLLVRSNRILTCWGLVTATLGLVSIRAEPCSGFF